MIGIQAFYPLISKARIEEITALQAAGDPDIDISDVEEIMKSLTGADNILEKDIVAFILQQAQLYKNAINKEE